MIFLLSDSSRPHSHFYRFRYALSHTVECDDAAMRGLSDDFMRHGPTSINNMTSEQFAMAMGGATIYPTHSNVSADDDEVEEQKATRPRKKRMSKGERKNQKKEERKARNESK